MRYILIFLILLIIIILALIIKNKVLLFKTYSLTFFISGIFMILISFIIKYLIKRNITFININKISNIITNKFIYISLIFIVLSIILYLISFIYKKHFNK